MELGIYPKYSRPSDYMNGKLVDFSDARNSSSDFPYPPPWAPPQFPFTHAEEILEEFQEILEELKITDIQAFDGSSPAQCQRRENISIMSGILDDFATMRTGRDPRRPWWIDLIAKRYFVSIWSINQRRTWFAGIWFYLSMYSFVRLIEADFNFVIEAMRKGMAAWDCGHPYGLHRNINDRYSS